MPKPKQNFNDLAKERRKKSQPEKVKEGKRQEQESEYKALLSSNDRYASYNPKSHFLTVEDKKLKRIVIPFTFDHVIGNKFAQSFGSSLEGELTKEQQDEIKRVVSEINSHPELGRMYRFVDVPSSELSKILLEGGVPNFAFSNLMCFRRISSGKITLGTSPYGKSSEGLRISTPRFSDRIFNNPTLTQNVILHEIGHAAFGLKHPVKRDNSDSPPFIKETDDVLERSIMVPVGDAKHKQCVLEATLREKKVDLKTTSLDSIYFSSYEDYALHCFDRWRNSYSELDIKAIKVQHKKALVPDNKAGGIQDEFASINAYGVDLTNVPKLDSSLDVSTAPTASTNSSIAQIGKDFASGLKSGIISSFCKELFLKLGLEENDANLAASGLVIALTATTPELAITAVTIDLFGRYFSNHLDQNEFVEGVISGLSVISGLDSAKLSLDCSFALEYASRIAGSITGRNTVKWTLEKLKPLANAVVSASSYLLQSVNLSQARTV